MVFFFNDTDEGRGGVIRYDMHVNCSRALSYLSELNKSASKAHHDANHAMRLLHAHAHFFVSSRIIGQSNVLQLSFAFIHI